MSKGKQTTLFQTWGYEGNDSFLPSSQQSQNRPSTQGIQNKGKKKTSDSKHKPSTMEEPKPMAEVINLDSDEEDVFGHDEEEDRILAQAMEESLAQFKAEQQQLLQEPQPGPSGVQKFSFLKRPSTTSPKNTYLQPKKSAHKPEENHLSNVSANDPVDFEDCPPIPMTEPQEDLPGYDLEAGRTWIYPTNYPVRKYQFDIVKSCLLDNTLVSLPTGLGKTFIAAVVMYNFYRWYPTGKVVFMAPTKVSLSLLAKYMSLW